MIARKYTKSISLWVTTTVADGYGGNVVTTALVQNLWANVTAKRAFRQNENGQNAKFSTPLFFGEAGMYIMQAVGNCTPTVRWHFRINVPPCQ